MFKNVFLLSATLVVCQAYGSSYGGSSSQGGGYGGGRSSSGGYGGSSGAGGYGGGNGGGKVAQLAIQTRQKVDFYDVPTQQNAKPTIIEVGANAAPVNLVFRSASSSLKVLQQHDGAQGSVQESQSEDEPHRLVHQVTKPIIQEVHEVITPMRKITQEIQPVQEEILTVVARGEENGASRGLGGSGGQGGSGGLGGPSSGLLGSSGGLGSSFKTSSLSRGSRLGGSGMHGSSAGGYGGMSSSGGSKGY